MRGGLFTITELSSVLPAQFSFDFRIFFLRCRRGGLVTPASSALRTGIDLPRRRITLGEGGVLREGEQGLVDFPRLTLDMGLVISGGITTGRVSLGRRER